MYKGHKCTDCKGLHEKHLSFWIWPEAVVIYKKSTGQSRSMLDHARRSRPVALPNETAEVEDDKGFHKSFVFAPDRSACSAAWFGVSGLAHRSCNRAPPKRPIEPLD